MRIDNGLIRSSILVFFTTLFYLLIICRHAQSLPSEIPTTLTDKKIELNTFAQGGHEINDKEKAISKEPLYTELELSSIFGDIFINPKYIGRVISVSDIQAPAGSSGLKALDVNTTEDGWSEIIVPLDESNLVGLNVTGTEGSLRISSFKKEMPSDILQLQPLRDIIIIFGQFRATFITPNFNLIKPGGFDIGIFDFNKNSFIEGDIVALKNNQIAVSFQGLPSSVFSEDGIIRLSLKDPAGSFLNSDLKAWGYNVYIPDTDIGKSAPIKADIFGLPKNAKLRFTFEPLEGQEFTSPVKTLTVEEINSGKSLTMITTSVPGSQPVRVKVEQAD